MDVVAPPREKSWRSRQLFAEEGFDGKRRAHDRSSPTPHLWWAGFCLVRCSIWLFAERRDLRVFPWFWLAIGIFHGFAAFVKARRRRLAGTADGPIAKVFE